MWPRVVALAGAAALAAGRAAAGAEDESLPPTLEEGRNRTLEGLRFPVAFEAIVNRSVVLDHFAETHELRVRSIGEEKDVEVEVQADASTVQSCNSTAPCTAANASVKEEDTVPPPSLQPTDRLVRVDGQEISVLSFQDVIDSPVGSVAVLPLFKPVDSVHVLSGFARVEILSPKMLEFEPATPEREEVAVAWVEEKARLRAEREAREREIANNKELQERLEQERRVAEALARKEQELLEKLDKEEYEQASRRVGVPLPSRVFDQRPHRAELGLEHERQSRRESFGAQTPRTAAQRDIAA